MNTSWKKPMNEASDIITKLIEDLGVSRAIAVLLNNRGIKNYEDAQRFFRPDLKELHDPFIMKGMQEAVDRIQLAIEKDEKILIYGDYDVDGTTAVALMYQYLFNFTQNIHYYIPDRYKEGYGVSETGINFAHDNDFSLIIALDCGIKAVEKVKRAKDLGIDFIICDHHTPGEEIPAAIILNPKQKDCPYPYKELCGCGIGFKLAQAINDTFALPFSEIEYLLDVVMVAIGADIVPITGENRILAFHGLRKLNELPRAGFKKILDIANKKGELNITDVVFIIAPRINAAGRIETGNKAVELLLATTIEKVEEITEEINNFNQLRKELDAQITLEALEIIEKDNWYKDAKTTVVFDENWHKGVVGIVASRLIEKIYRPTIVLTESNGFAVGSARSVKDFDVYEAIDKCSDLLLQFGGHKYAAGLTLEIENIEKFREKFDDVVAKSIHKTQLNPIIEIEETLDFRDIFGLEKGKIPKFFRILKQFAPFGPGNMNPIFLSENVRVFNHAKILKDEHLKLTLYQEEYPQIQIEAIGFNLAKFYPEILNKPFSITYTIEENLWNETSSLQLNLKDIRFDVKL